MKPPKKLPSSVSCILKVWCSKLNVKKRRRKRYLDEHARIVDAEKLEARHVTNAPYDELNGSPLQDRSDAERDHEDLLASPWQRRQIDAFTFLNKEQLPGEGER